MKYLKYFERTSDTKSYLGGNNVVYPNVTYNTEEPKVYFINDSSENPYIENALCLTAQQPGSTVLLSENGTPYGNQFEFNQYGEWEIYMLGTPISLDNVGDKVYFRNSSEVIQNLSENIENYYGFEITGSVSASGDVTSLISKNGKVSVIPSTYCFCCLFKDCTSLTSVPNLPSTILKNNCYDRMFYGCTGITSVPKDLLPAPIMTTGCYQNMFSGCTLLQNTPYLNSLELSQNCYNSMFYGCSSLTDITELPSIRPAQYCYYSMFENCTSIVTAPELNAPGLDSGCYNRMFAGCSRLESITALCTGDIIGDEYGCTFNWTDGVSPTGSFIRSKNSNWTTGVSGIPSGWLTIPK